MWYAIVLGTGVVLGVVISRVLDSKFDKIQIQLQELLAKVQK